MCVDIVNPVNSTSWTTAALLYLIRVSISSVPVRLRSSVSNVQHEPGWLLRLLGFDSRWLPLNMPLPSPCWICLSDPQWLPVHQTTRLTLIWFVYMITDWLLVYWPLLLQVKTILFILYASESFPCGSTNPSRWRESGGKGGWRELDVWQLCLLVHNGRQSRMKQA